MATNYNARLLAKDLMYYFHINPSAIEVIIFKGSSLFLVKRMMIADKDFVRSSSRDTTDNTKAVSTRDGFFLKMGGGGEVLPSRDSARIVKTYALTLQR
jgi:hypothetical protein